MIALIARIVLAGVFALSGLAKLIDRKGSRQALRDFGVPGVLAAPLGVLLPLAELALAALLLPGATAWWGALGALGLLAAFTAVIAVNLLRGYRPDCRCFGRLSAGPIGRTTVARNSGLMAIAGVVLWQGQQAPTPELGAAVWFGLSAGGLTVLLLGGMGWLLFALWRQQGRLLLRLEALEAGEVLETVPGPKEERMAAAGLLVGSAAPDFRLTDLGGSSLSLSELRAAGKPVLLLFTDPHCGPCNALLPQFGRWQDEHAGRLNLVLISRGTAADNLAKAAEHKLSTVLLQRDFEVAEALHVKGTPSAILIRADGTVGSPVAGGVQAITELVAKIAPAPSPREQLPAAAKPAEPRLGQPAPDVILADSEGRPVRLTDFRGRDTLLLFWNSGCGFCQRMLEDLRRWERDMPAGAPRLLLLTPDRTGETTGLRAPILLDEGFAAGRAFGVRGTPSAILIDAEGKVASKVAVGAAAVLELARQGLRPSRRAKTPTAKQPAVLGG
ncbi:MAG: redoxin domain-containing protein [Deinococcota bacterium]|nr:redoxin domain-containing protein [Deinococcota bacterium]